MSEYNWSDLQSYNPYAELAHEDGLAYNSEIVPESVMDMDLEGFFTDILEDPDDFADIMSVLDEVTSEEDHKYQEYLDSFTDVDILDVLAHFEIATTANSKEFYYKPQKSSSYKLITTKQKPVELYQPVEADSYIVEFNDPNVNIVFGDQKHLVGLYTGEYLSYKKENVDLVELTGKFSEHTKMKGTCLGYSSFVHLMAVLAIAPNDAIIEPYEGHDIQFNDLSVEVTGLNWRIRSTNCKATIAKYLVTSLLCKDDIAKEMIRLSYKEDRFESDAFLNTSIDQENSPYTHLYSKLHDLTTSMSLESAKMLYQQYKFYYSRLPKVSMTHHDHKNVLSLKQVDEAMIRGAKKDKSNNHQRVLPAPFRVLPSLTPFSEAESNINTEVYVGTLSIGTSFHTRTMPYDPTRELITPDKKYLHINPYNRFEPISMLLFKNLLSYPIFYSSYVESVLLGKIVGKRGFYTCPYTNTGICWQNTRHSSNIYYINYYSKEKHPREKVGDWREHPSIPDCWISPCIKLSVNDINFATILPYRIATQVMSCLPYCKGNGETQHRMRPYVTQQIMLLMTTLRWSTWQTSKLTGDTRFLTLILLSASGKPQELIDKIAQSVQPNISLPDYNFLCILKNSLTGYNFTDFIKTPLLKLPIKFLAIEKDWPLYHQWHMREANHATNCYKKLCQGLIEEKIHRESRLRSLEMQVDYLYSTEEKTQDDFNALMNSMPKIPYYNHLIVLALSYRSVEELDRNKRKDPVKMSLSHLISDHNATVLNKQYLDRDTVITKTTVAEGFCRLDNTLQHPNSIHEAVIKLARLPKVLNLYFIHPKDAKSKDREIPQMTMEMRLTQYMSEALVTIYTDAEETDMMQKPEKYSKFIREFSHSLSKGGYSRSEDRSFFCGNIQPEALSLATLTIGKLMGSSHLTTSAAIQRCNKTRYTVCPVGCDPSIIPEDDSNVTITAIKQNKRFPVIASKTYYHMQQGVLAINAALLTTLFTSGMDLLHKDIVEDKVQTCVMTTSDDSARTAYMSKRKPHSRKLLMDWIMKPVTQLHHVMMKDSDDKPIESGKLAEFNNVATGPHGMFPQSFVHPHLMIQYLNGMNPLDDIQQALSQSRASLTWGDGIDAIRTAYMGFLSLLRQKWLFTHSEIDFLKEAFILPQDDQDLIRGISIANFNTVKCLWSLVSPDIKEDVLSGRTNILSGLRMFNVKDKIKKHVTLVKYSGNLIPVRRAVEQINAARRIQIRQNPKYHRYIPLDKRIAAKNQFMRALTTIQPDPDKETSAQLGVICFKPEVLIKPTRPTRRDFMPQRMGNKVRTENMMNITSIESYKYFKLFAQTKLSPKEHIIASMEDKDYDRWWFRSKTLNDRLGTTWDSPSGKPLMLALNNQIMYKPMSMNIEYILPQSGKPLEGITLLGTYYVNFVPCWLSDSLIDKARKLSAHICIGHATLNDERHIFWCENKRDIYKRTIPYKRENISTFSYKGKNYINGNAPNKSAIRFSAYVKLSDYGAFPSSVTGDQDSVLNYGNYINSQNYRGSSLCDQIYAVFNSYCPKFIHQRKRPYPIHLANSTVIRYGQTAYVMGLKSICTLKLEHSVAITKLTTYINCHDDLPVEVTHTEPQPIEEDEDIEIE